MASRTLLHPYHVAHATMGEFGGFEMPLWYEGIIPEVNAVRRKAGIFDVSHMGRTLFTGEGAGRFLDYLTTNDIAGLAPMQTRYTLICNEEGGVVDDTIAVRTGEESYVTFWNASNREKDTLWAKERRGRFEVKMEDRSDASFMIALQGPKAHQVLQPLCKIDLSRVKRHMGAWTRVAGMECCILRTGYTGEDGFEIFSLTDSGGALPLWNRLIDGGATPAGLGARDVLRIEAGLPLYGHELTDTISPLEARLDFAVKMEKGEFVGRRAIAALMQKGLRRRLTGLRMRGRGIPRNGYAIFYQGKEVGVVTSGTFSPTLGGSIALGFIEGELPCGAELQVRIRGTDHSAFLSETPFYDQDSFGWRRKASPL
jgi:aminomethyltransferase